MLVVAVVVVVVVVFVVVVLKLIMVVIVVVVKTVKVIIVRVIKLLININSFMYVIVIDTSYKQMKATTMNKQHLQQMQDKQTILLHRNVVPAAARRRNITSFTITLPQQFVFHCDRLIDAPRLTPFSPSLVRIDRLRPLEKRK